MKNLTTLAAVAALAAFGWAGAASAHTACDLTPASPVNLVLLDETDVGNVMIVCDAPAHTITVTIDTTEADRILI